MTSRFFATLKRQPVALRVADPGDLVVDPEKEAMRVRVRDADIEALRDIATEARIAFHPATSAEKMRRRLLERMES